MPAKVVEDYIIATIQQDLAKLRDDDQLHAYVAAELRRATGGRTDARDQLRRRLADLDQQAAKLRDHLLAMDPAAAKALGMYEQAQVVAVERAQVEAQLAAMPGVTPNLPALDEIRRRAAAEFDRIADLLAAGTVEEKRALIGCYVQKIKADPDRQSVQIGLCPPLLSPKIVWS